MEKEVSHPVWVNRDTIDRYYKRWVMYLHIQAKTDRRYNHRLISTMFLTGITQAEYVAIIGPLLMQVRGYLRRHVPDYIPEEHKSTYLPDHLQISQLSDNILDIGGRQVESLTGGSRVNNKAEQYELEDYPQVKDETDNLTLELFDMTLQEDLETTDLLPTTPRLVAHGDKAYSGTTITNADIRPTVGTSVHEIVLAMMIATVRMMIVLIHAVELHHRVAGVPKVVEPVLQVH